jgi:hypothetical protein
MGTQRIAVSVTVGTYVPDEDKILNEVNNIVVSKKEEEKR